MVRALCEKVFLASTLFLDFDYKGESVRCSKMKGESSGLSKPRRPVHRQSATTMKCTLACYGTANLIVRSLSVCWDSFGNVRLDFRKMFCLWRGH